jgi:hypothetical protein
MRNLLVLAAVLAGSLSLLTTEASAVVCAKGVRGAACVGPNGAVAGRRYYGGAVIHGHRGYGGTTVRRYSGPYRSLTVIRHY